MITQDKSTDRAIATAQLPVPEWPKRIVIASGVLVVAVFAVPTLAAIRILSSFYGIGTNVYRQVNGFRSDEAEEEIAVTRHYWGV